MEKVLEIKAKIFDIIEKQESLQGQFQNLEREKRALSEELKKLRDSQSKEKGM